MIPTRTPSTPDASFLLANTLDVEFSLISSPSAAMASHSSLQASAQYPSLPGAMRKHSLTHLAWQNAVSAATTVAGETPASKMAALIARGSVDRARSKRRAEDDEDDDGDDDAGVAGWMEALSVRVDARAAPRGAFARPRREEAAETEEDAARVNMSVGDRERRLGRIGRFGVKSSSVLFRLVCCVIVHAYYAYASSKLLRSERAGCSGIDEPKLLFSSFVSTSK